MAISQLATPYMFENFGAVRWNSRGGTPITTIVVHHAATTNFDAMPGVWATREASAHYGIGQNGEIRAYVDEDKSAWHCGNGNSYSIGIECTNTSGDPNWVVSDNTVDALVVLIKEIESRRGKLQIVGHRDVPGNATVCPGPSLYPRLQEIRDRVNGGGTTNPVPPAPTPEPPPQVQNDVDYMRQYGKVVWNGKQFNVDDRSRYANIWQVVSNELGGLTPSPTTTETEWINNGVPMSAVSWTDGTPQSSVSGNRFKFNQDTMAIVDYDVPSNGIAVMVEGHKIWVDATVARKA